MPQKNKADYRRYQREKHKEVRRERKAKALAHLGGKCQRCGEKDPATLEFHHILEETKKAGIAHLTLYRWEVVLAELAKCKLLCKACHMLTDFRIDITDYEDYQGVGSCEKVYDDDVPF